MRISNRIALALLPISIFGLASCGDDTPAPKPDEVAVEESYEKMKSQLEELEQDAEDFREEIARAMDQQAVSDMTPEELEALRNGEIEIPEGVDLPPEE